MRPEISNELLLQVIQAWDPDKMDSWWVTICNKTLIWESVGIREHNARMCPRDYPWEEASKLVEFLLKDRPKLHRSWDPKVLRKTEKEIGTSWTADPFVGIGYEPTPKDIVRRLKSYEYLKEWKETQEHLELQDRLVECGKINPGDITLTIDGQTIEGMEIYDDVLSVPTTYEAICPHCNGSKEIVGWYGKEVCNAC